MSIWIYPKNQDKDLISHLLKSRNISDSEKFFSPDLSHLNDPFLIHDMDKACEVIMDYVKNNRKIFIHGDFDVDGITATSTLWNFLFKDLKANALPYIPNRFVEGYGLSEDSIQNIIEQGGELIITVDCGVKDIELVHKYSNRVKFIITDHHTILDKTTVMNFNNDQFRQIGENIISKDALAVVHPGLGGIYPFHEISGAVVAFKVVTALNKKFNLGININKYLPLAALGTICDIMPLIDENRAIVTHGLRMMPRTEIRGLLELLNQLNLKDSIDTYHVGFLIGPRINATGRIDEAIDAVRLFSTDSVEYAQKLILKLEELNSQRQNLTKEYLDIADKQVQNEKDRFILVYGDEWPEGILGLISSKLTDKFYRPSMVGSNKNGKIKFSSRSIGDINITTLLSQNAELLDRYGGHAQAAGFTIDKKNIESFKISMQKLMTEFQDEIFERKLIIDYLVDLNEIDVELIKLITKFAPFGQGNFQPIFAVHNLKVKQISTVGADKKHVKLLLSAENGFVLNAIYFNGVEQTKDIKIGDVVDVAGNFDVDTWNGFEKISFKIKEVRRSE